MRRIAKAILIVGVTAAVGLVAVLTFAFGWSREDSGKHLPHVERLPAEASDVTYAKREGFGWFTCYECSLPKAALERLAPEKGWKLEPKSQVSMGGLRTPRGLPALKKGEYRELDFVEKALFYEKRQPNGGGITVIYDLDTGRLFVNESHR
jgi:hypothetical protein